MVTYNNSHSWTLATTLNGSANTTHSWSLSISYVDSYEIVTNPITVSVDDTVLEVTPSPVTISITGGLSQTPADITIDSVLVGTVTLDSDGSYGPISLPVNEDDPFATQGDHTVLVTQVAADLSTITSQATTFTYVNPQPVLPVSTPPDSDPVPVIGAVNNNVRHFVFQDLAVGGIGSYVFPINPSAMTSPHQEYAYTSKRTTAEIGQFHVFESATMPHEWQLTGFCPTAEMEAAILAFRNINRRFYVIDHHNRAWMCVFLDANFIPRLRQNYNGMLTDWGSDYTLTFAVLDQNWATLS